MQKNGLVLVLWVAVLASAVQAKNPSESVDRLVQRLAVIGNSRPTMPSHTTGRAGGCADYAGEWEGECIHDGKTLPGKIRTSIRQHGCVNIRYEGVEHLIGGSTHVDLVAPRGTIAPLAENLKQSYLPYWSEDRQKLLVRVTALSHTIDAFNGGNTLVSGLQTWTLPSPGVLKMETDLQIDGFVGPGTLKLNSRIECTYQKL